MNLHAYIPAIVRKMTTKQGSFPKAEYGGSIHRVNSKLQKWEFQDFSKTSKAWKKQEFSRRVYIKLYGNGCLMYFQIKY